MSVQALGWILDHSPATGVGRLVLVSIANHASGDPEGDPLAWEAYPGIATIAREARLDRQRTVTEAVSRLVAAGQLVRVVNGAPDERIPLDRRPNLYRILMDAGVACGLARCRWCDPGVSPTRTPVEKVLTGANGVTPGADSHPVQATPKPSLTNRKPRAAVDRWGAQLPLVGDRPACTTCNRYTTGLIECDREPCPTGLPAAS